jgi:hypothetical protein
MTLDDNFDNSVEIIDEYRRLNFPQNQHIGLIPINECNTSNNLLNIDFIYRKLKYNDELLFSKKRPSNHYSELEKQEYENIIKAYEYIDTNNLIKFYGVSKKFGLIFEWVDDFKYIGKKKLNIADLSLKDVDVIELKDGTTKYIDFER